MATQPIDEIFCCNCPQCQAYILKLVQRIEALENVVKELKTVYSWERARYIVVTEEPIEWKTPQ